MCNQLPVKGLDGLCLAEPRLDGGDKLVERAGTCRVIQIAQPVHAQEQCIVQGFELVFRRNADAAPFGTRERLNLDSRVAEDEILM